MNEINCLLCDAKSDNVVIQENGYDGKKCPQCGLIYVSPRPSYDDIVDLYGHDDAHVSATDHVSAAFRKQLFARHHLGIISSFATDGALLDVGAGAGAFLAEARNAGFTPYGLEFNPIQAEFIRTELGIPCEESPLSTSIFDGKRFDVVYHCDVLSHFFDPVAEFRTMHELLNEDGMLVFETGNLGDVNERYYQRFLRFQYPDHLFFFGTENLRWLLESTGFDVLEIYRYSISPQLLLEKATAGLRGRLSSSNHKRPSAGETSAEQSPSGANRWPPAATGGAKSLIKKAWHYVNYLVRYKTSFVAPGHDKPQTVIVVARRT